jgi:hypothetical protein
MLFTDGPDEAIQPLILGLSAATLLAVSGTLTATSLIATPALFLRRRGQAGDRCAASNR